jgi:hypothetical protein
VKTLYPKLVWLISMIKRRDDRHFTVVDKFNQPLLCVQMLVQFLRSKLVFSLFQQFVTYEKLWITKSKICQFSWCFLLVMKISYTNSPKDNKTFSQTAEKRRRGRGFSVCQLQTEEQYQIFVINKINFWRCWWHLLIVF